MASNARVAPVAVIAAVNSCMNAGDDELQTCTAPRARSASSCACDRTMFTKPTPSARQILLSIWPRLDAAAVWTSAVCPSRLIVSTIPSAVSGLTKHEAPSAARRAFGQHETLLGLDAAVLRVHRPADHGHRLTQQRPGLVRCPGGDDDARTFVSDRHGLVKTTGDVSHPLGGNRGGHHRMGGRAGIRRGAHVGRAEQQPQVRGVERRGFDAHQHFVRQRIGHWNADQGQFQLAVRSRQRAQLKARACRVSGHRECGLYGREARSIPFAPARPADETANDCWRAAAWQSHVLHGSWKP